MTESLSNTADYHRLAHLVCDRGLAAPAVFFLEMYKPVSTLIGSGALLCEPLLKIFFTGEATATAIDFLQSRENIERLICEIEEISRLNKAQNREKTQNLS